MKTLMIGSAAALLFAGSALAGEVSMTWDTDNDGMISAEEYGVAMEHNAMFDAWDADEDGMLSAEEFTAGTWKAFDTDEDEMWSQTEAGVWEDSAIRSGAEVNQ